MGNMSRHLVSLVPAKAGCKQLDENLSFRYLNIPALLSWWLNGKLLRRNKLGGFMIYAFEALSPLIRPVDDFLHEVLRIPLGNSLLAVYEIPDAPRT